MCLLYIISTWIMLRRLYYHLKKTDKIIIYRYMSPPREKDFMERFFDKFKNNFMLKLEQCEKAI